MAAARAVCRVITRRHREILTPEVRSGAQRHQEIGYQREVADFVHGEIEQHALLAAPRRGLIWRQAVGRIGLKPMPRRFSDGAVPLTYVVIRILSALQNGGATPMAANFWPQGPSSNSLSCTKAAA